MITEKDKEEITEQDRAETLTIRLTTHNSGIFLKKEQNPNEINFEVDTDKVTIGRIIDELKNEQYKRIKIELNFHGSKQNEIIINGSLHVHHIITWAINPNVNKNIESLYIVNKSCYASSKLSSNDKETIEDIKQFIIEKKAQLAKEGDKRIILYAENTAKEKTFSTTFFAKNITLQDRKKLFNSIIGLNDILDKYLSEHHNGDVITIIKVLNNIIPPYNFTILVNPKVAQYYQKIANGSMLTDAEKLEYDEAITKTNNIITDIRNNKNIDTKHYYKCACEALLNNNDKTFINMLLNYFKLEDGKWKKIEADKTITDPFDRHEEEKRLKNEIFYGKKLKTKYEIEKDKNEMFYKKKMEEQYRDAMAYFYPDIFKKPKNDNIEKNINNEQNKNSIV